MLHLKRYFLNILSTVDCCSRAADKGGGCIFLSNGEIVSTTRYFIVEEDEVISTRFSSHSMEATRRLAGNPKHAINDSPRLLALQYATLIGQHGISAVL